MEAHNEQEVAIDFCTLGMFIIDEIHFSTSRPPVYDVIGGAGSYAALGARLFSPAAQSSSVGWIVDCGSDFPGNTKRILEDWGTSCLFRLSSNRLTTRGWNQYGLNEHRAFKYLTPKLRLEASSCSPALIQSKCFHLICSPLRCIEQVTAVVARRRKEFPHLRRPLFVWEPVPDVCNSQELDACRRALRMVDVVSPNHAEIAAFFDETGEIVGEVDKAAVERHAASWLSSGVGADAHGGVVVRCGRHGCFAINQSSSAWIPAYHAYTQGKVVDPTGGGNTFLGGLAVAMARGIGLEESAIWGSIAASFAIEQIGMPTLVRASSGEVWNGDSVAGRLDSFRSKLQ